jgi:hypothetical protein
MSAKAVPVIEESLALKAKKRQPIGGSGFVRGVRLRCTSRRVQTVYLV